MRCFPFQKKNLKENFGFGVKPLSELRAAQPTTRDATGRPGKIHFFCPAKSGQEKKIMSQKTLWVSHYDFSTLV
jgi:hypothetical protein